ncbi:hypothetical protein TNCV_74091 [Trichonephila clavipes]|nr:hypothetical protein TNCV_74091 [Trichonephila clavipes]
MTEEAFLKDTRVTVRSVRDDTCIQQVVHLQNFDRPFRVCQVLSKVDPIMLIEDNKRIRVQAAREFLQDSKTYDQDFLKLLGTRSVPTIHHCKRKKVP